MEQSRSDGKLGRLRFAFGVAAILLVVIAVLLLKGPAQSAATGLAIAWLLSSFSGLLTGWASDSWDVADPLKADGGGRVSLIKSGNGRGPFVLGVAEVSLFYAALLVDAPELIAGWLVFKTAAKWAAWQHIMRVPESLDGLDQYDWVRYRHDFSSKIVTGFMLGTIVNILVAMLAFGVASWSS